MGYGIQRSERGGLAAHAVSLLPAIIGSWKEVGGGLQLTTSGGFQLNRTALERPDLQKLSALGREARILNMAELGKILTGETDGGAPDPPVKAIVVYNSNPAAIAPNQNRVRNGLRREDLFTVVLEQFLTDTAVQADIVLPATSFLEHTDLYYSYGHYYLQLARPVLPAPGECKRNVEVFQLLAKAMGFTDGCFLDSDDDMMRQAIDSEHPYLRAVSLEDLERTGRARLDVSSDGKPFLPHAEGGFGTPSGRCEFHADRLDYRPPIESRFGELGRKGKYPLELISAKAERGMNSTFGHRDGFDQECAVVKMNPADAARRGIGDGDAVRVFNDRGSVRLTARLSKEVKPGLLSVLAVRWAHRSADDMGINALTNDTLTDLGGGPAFFSCLVDVQMG
jgi:anaerobic selenocysteine-containing dehydrogenase